MGRQADAAVVFGGSPSLPYCHEIRKAQGHTLASGRSRRLREICAHVAGQGIGDCRRPASAAGRVSEGRTFYRRGDQPWFLPQRDYQ